MENPSDPFEKRYLEYLASEFDGPPPKQLLQYLPKMSIIHEKADLPHWNEMPLDHKANWLMGRLKEFIAEWKENPDQFLLRRAPID